MINYWKKWLFSLGFLGLWTVVLFGCSYFPKMTILDDPLEKEEHLKLGQAYEKDGNLELAEKEYRAAQPLSGAYLALGNLYFNRSEDRESRRQAEQFYRRALNTAPSPEAANNLAWLYLLDGKLLNVAEKLAQRAISEGTKAGLDEISLKNFQDTLAKIQKAQKETKKGGD